MLNTQCSPMDRIPLLHFEMNQTRSTCYTGSISHECNSLSDGHTVQKS